MDFLLLSRSLYGKWEGFGIQTSSDGYSLTWFTIIGWILLTIFLLELSFHYFFYSNNIGIVAPGFNSKAARLEHESPPVDCSCHEPQATLRLEDCN